MVEQAKDMDLEKGIQGGMDAQVPAMAGGQEHKNLIPDPRIQTIEEGVVAAKMNPGLKKWLLYWLLLAVSVMALTSHLFPGGEDHDDAAPKDQLIKTPAAAMFAMLLCAICLLFRTMKQMMM